METEQKKQQADMKVSKNEILLIYNSNNLQDRHAYGYAQSLRDYSLKTIDVHKDELSETQIKTIANMLEVEPEDLIDQQSSKFQREYADKDISSKEILTILKKNPVMINTPIVLYEDHGVL
jgi:arsenate reductase-like glutaredoxin family protein